MEPRLLLSRRGQPLWASQALLGLGAQLEKAEQDLVSFRLQFVDRA